MHVATIKPDNIPLWVTLYGGLLAVIGTYLGIAALLTPSTAVGYTHGAEMIAGAWAGRTLGLALIMALAIWCRSPQAYTIAFLGCVCREGGDVIGALNAGNSGLVPVLGAFLTLDAICLYLSARALRRTA